MRRVTDERGREWRVREVWSVNGAALLYQCAVPGARAEVRCTRSLLESLSDDDLIAALETAGD